MYHQGIKKNPTLILVPSESSDMLLCHHTNMVHINYVQMTDVKLYRKKEKYILCI